MRGLQIDDELNQDISALTNASRKELVEHWNLTYGRLPPERHQPAAAGEISCL